MYRIIATGARPTAKDRIVLDCSFQTSQDGETWAAIEGAPATLELSLSAVRGALRSPGGEPEQRTALQELIRTTARSLPILAGAVAVEQISDLLPSGWPVTIRV